MLSTLRSNLAGILLALSLSAVLWAIVVNQHNPAETGLFPQGIRIKPERLPPGLVLVNEGALPEVVVRITTTKDQWERLQPSAFRATVDLAGATPGSREYPVRVEVRDGRVRLESYEPARVLLHLEELATKEVPVVVRVQQEPPFGYTAKPPRVAPEQVAVSGPKSLVEQVAVAAIEVRLGSEHADFRRELRPVPQTMAGDEVKGLTLSPERVLVEIAIEQQVTYKAVPVVPQVEDSVAMGYQIAGLGVEPPTAMIVGEPKALDQVAYLRTRPVSVSGLSADTVRSAELVVPSGVSLARRQSVSVLIYINYLYGSQLLRLAPVIHGLGPNLKATPAPGVVEVRLVGPMPTLINLKPNDVRVTLDLAGLGPGTHFIAPQVDFPPILRLDQVLPEKVAVTIAR